MLVLTVVLVVDRVFQSLNRGGRRTHGLHGRGLPKRDPLPRRGVEGRLRAVHRRGERTAPDPCDTRNRGTETECEVLCCVAQNGEMSRNPAEFECPAGWTWGDKWTVDDNRAVDDQGATGSDGERVLPAVCRHEELLCVCVGAAQVGSTESLFHPTTSPGPGSLRRRSTTSTAGGGSSGPARERHLLQEPLCRSEQGHLTEFTFNVTNY